jgi:adenylate kinase
MLASHAKKVGQVVLFEIPDEELVIRLSGRRTCPSCGTMYHIAHAKPRVDGVCDHDGAALIQRDDDRPEIIKKRLSVYHEQTAPLADFYRGEKILKSIDARRSQYEVSADLGRALSG